MKPIILFDIDLTLFDTNHFRKFYSQKFISILKITTKDFIKLRDKYTNTLEKSTDFLPETYLKHIANHFSKTNTHELYLKLHNLYYQSENYSQSLFSDVFMAFKNLSTSHILGIYSEGFSAFQKAKLVKSKIYDFFDPKYFFVFRRKTDPSSLDQLPPHCQIVDDKSEIITAVNNYSKPSFNPIWLNRNSKSKHPHARTIHSLTELV